MTATMVRSDAAQHGSRRRYQLGCRCFQCRLSDSRYRQLWRQGGRRRVPIKRILGHLDRLERSGWTHLQINEAAELGNSTLWHIRSGRQRWVNSSTARAILALQPRDPAPGWLVRLATHVGRRHGATGTAVLSWSDVAATVTARHELMRLLRDTGWSCRAVGHVMHRTEITVSHQTCQFELPADLRADLRALLDEVPDPIEPPDDVDEPQAAEATPAKCEDCDDEPMGGGRWCYPHYLQHRSAA